MLESEVNVIIDSVVQVIDREHMGYLKSPAYKFLTDQCYGFKDFGSWSGFTSAHTPQSLHKLLIANQARNQKDIVVADIYNSIVNALILKQWT